MSFYKNMVSVVAREMYKIVEQRGQIGIEVDRDRLAMEYQRLKRIRVWLECKGNGEKYCPCGGKVKPDGKSYHKPTCQNSLPQLSFLLPGGGSVKVNLTKYEKDALLAHVDKGTYFPEPITLAGIACIFWVHRGEAIIFNGPSRCEFHPNRITPNWRTS